MDIENTTTIGEILAADKGAARILMEFGMHCVGCSSSRYETLEQACAVHVANVDELVHQLTEYFVENEL